jgi:hypothetical protein
MEEAEEQNRLAVAREMHDREVSHAAETEHKRQEQKRFGREQEEEKKRKHAEHKRQVEQFFSEEQMQLRQRLESMQYAEKKKQDAILKKQTEAAETLRVRRNAIEKRIEQVRIQIHPIYLYINIHTHMYIHIHIYTYI